jgi:hypothetical protein
MLTHADACWRMQVVGLGPALEDGRIRGSSWSLRLSFKQRGTQFTCFSCTKVQILTHKALQDAAFRWEILSPKWRRLQCTIASLNYLLDTSPSPRPRLLHLHPHLAHFDAHSHTQRDHSLRPRPDTSSRNVAFARNGGVAYGEAHVFSPFRYADLC